MRSMSLLTSDPRRNWCVSGLCAQVWAHLSAGYLVDRLGHRSAAPGGTAGDA